MTLADLERIAEEHERYKGAEVEPFVFETLMENWAARIRAWIAAEREFIEATSEWNRLREAMSNFGKDPTTHMDEWHDLSHAHLEAEKKMREAYRARRERAP